MNKFSSLGVANILTNEGGIQDPHVIAAALLHDTVEDTKTTFEEIRALFGEEVSFSTTFLYQFFVF